MNLFLQRKVKKRRIQMTALEERLNRLPNSRKYDLGIGELPPKITKD
jgi:hypothetical protein